MSKDKLNVPRKMLVCEVGTCPVTTSLSVMGGKWKASILYALDQEGTLRFGELKRVVVNITQKMLTSQLRELEADGLVNRRVYAEVPPRVEYRLTDYGQSVQPVLRALAKWGSTHMERC